MAASSTLSQLSHQSESAVHATIASAALTAERAICVARLFFFTAILARFLGVTNLTAGRVLVTAIPLALGILFSIYVLAAIRTPPKGERLWVTSVSLDAIACFCALLPNALWPTPEHVGIVNLPDTVGVFIATIGAGFRLSPAAAVGGGALNLLGLIVLVSVDRAISGGRLATSLATSSLYVIYVGGFGALAVILAVTTRRLVRRGALVALRADLLAEQDRLKSSFFANVSHELRTPLTLILTPLRQLLAHSGQQLPAATADRLRSMEGNSQRLLRLVNQLLDLSAIEFGGTTVAFEKRDLKRLVEPIVEAFTPFARSKELELVLRGPDDPVEAYVDPEKLDKVLSNLLSNACKFTDPGGTVVVRLAAEGGAAQLSVKDTGHGIAEAHLPRIFDRFRQLDDAASRQHQGSGIGLALAKELVELMGGTLNVASELGVGSTFTVTLPLGTAHIADPGTIRPETGDHASTAAGAAAALAAEVRPGRAPEPGEPGPAGGSDPTRPLVLVVEDNADMRALVSEICRDEFRVIAAADGQEGLELVREHRPALVIADVMMPRMDGHELLRHVRAAPETATIPVILLTARVGPEMRLEGLEHGADDYLFKPFEARELLARARNMVRLQQQERELRQLNAGLQQEVVRQASALERARNLRRYLPPDIFRSVLEEDAPPTQERRRLTVFRLELRGFDDLAETVEPEEMVALLNGYLSEMTELAFEHGATVDKLLRDTVMGFFGAPRSAGPEQDALRCARMAVEMWQRAVEVVDRWRGILDGRPPTPTLVLTSGYATVGNFGSSNRLEYTAVGGAVDEAASLLAATGPGEVICSASTWTLVKGEIEGEPCGEADVRRRSQPVRLFRLAGPLEPVAPDPALSETAPPQPPAAAEAEAPWSGGELKPGTILAGRYEAVRRLGRGGMGIVYQVRDLKLGADVALKLVRYDLDETGIVERLHREVRLARLVSHCNVARIYDLGEWKGLEFISMEYIRGETLEHRLKTTGALSVDEGYRVLHQLCAGLSAAHAAGVVHRDLKPTNIMLEENGRAVILDFGVARWTSVALPSTEASRPMGTPHYMAPEQFEGGEVDQRADIYSLGVVAYELFTGVRPFEADSPVSLALKHLEQPPPDPLQLRPELPPRLTAVILRCLAKAPRDRFGSVGEIISLLSDSLAA